MRKMGVYSNSIHLLKRYRKGSNGGIPLIPKDEGTGVMISVFVSRVFLYVISLIGEDLTNVN